jgi:hypothetical protein
MSRNRVDGQPQQRCELCKYNLGRHWSAADSVSGDQLADHLLDYHQAEVSPGKTTFAQAVRRARALAGVLRAGGVHAYRLALQLETVRADGEAVDRADPRQLDLFAKRGSK